MDKVIPLLVPAAMELGSLLGYLLVLWCQMLPRTSRRSRACLLPPYGSRGLFVREVDLREVRIVWPDPVRKISPLLKPGVVALALASGHVGAGRSSLLLSSFWFLRMRVWFKAPALFD